MSVDTPARIAIVGAGPVGLEAALYARYLGYEVILLEQHTPCHSLLQQSAELLPQTAGQNRTSLGLAALRAQNEDFPLPDPDSRETASTLTETYFRPLAATDLLADCIRLGHTVLRIERTEFPEEELAAQDHDQAPAELDEDSEFEEIEELEYAPFELLLRLPDGTELTERAAVVIDASGSSNSTPILSESLRIEPESPIDSPADSASSERMEMETLEPNFYLLGSRSTAASAFTLAAGHDQIRRLFAILGGRESLNLYETFR